MNYFAPGFREMVRTVQRLGHRERRFLARRNLAKAETQLGLLGWQQADYDAETQRQVDALQNIEREQARAGNRSAELARELQTLAQKRAEGRAAYEKARASLEGERTTVRQPLADLQHRAETVRSEMSDGEHKSARLDKEQRDLEELSNKLLLVNPQPPDTRKELLRLRDRVLAIENERKDLKSAHARSLGDAQHLKQQIEAIEHQSAEFDHRLRELRDAFESADGDLAKQEHVRMHEKGKAEAEADRLERAKSDPYREIGRVLADHMIPPMNQPEALDRVLRLREEVQNQEEAIASLQRESKSVDQTELRVSLGLWGVVFLALALFFAALL